MGHFKSLSKKKKIQRKIIIFLLEMILILIIIKIIRTNYKINEDKLIYLTYTYLGKAQKKENNEKTIFKETEESTNQRSPTVYIYNTHQTENYLYDKVNSYNLDYNVMFASYILKEYLNDYDIKAIVENESLKNILNENNLTYKDSYKASRILLEQSIINYPTLIYFIDLHRDSSVYEKTTCVIDNKSYAKILFVLGLENKNYLENEKMINSLNERLIKINSCLSRGITKKSGVGVDGVYNQDFSSNAILIEVGGQYNTITEVNNTLEIFAKILVGYIMEG
ncbi:MAG: stage II sporulation protein P [bacterium]|nr:stage II sporulation protein P [bacterium]